MLNGDNQKGFVHWLLPILILLLVAVAGFVAWKQVGDKEPQGSQEGSKNEQVQVGPDEVHVSGKVEFTEQGPTDAPTGTRPSTATISVATEQDMMDWKKSSVSTPSDPGLADSKKPPAVKVMETDTGKLGVTLKKNSDVLCLLSAVSIDTHEGYDIFDCKKFNTEGSSATANIHLIGFGSNYIECEKSVCTGFNLE